MTVSDKRRKNRHGERVTQRQQQNLRTRLGREAKSCSAYGNKDVCPFFDNCVVEIQTDRIASNTCPTFVTAVLPGNPSLEKEYIDALPDLHPVKVRAEGIAEDKPEGKRCETCDKEFTPRSNRQKYCTKCSAERRKESEAKRQRDRSVTDALERR